MSRKLNSLEEYLMCAMLLEDTDRWMNCLLADQRICREVRHEYEKGVSSEDVNSLEDAKLFSEQAAKRLLKHAGIADPPPIDWKAIQVVPIDRT